MSESTTIEWCDSTFNPWIGCTEVSPGCDHCYARHSTPARTLGVKWGPGQARYRTKAANWEKVRRWNAEHEAFFAVHGRRRRVFSLSLGDIADKDIPAEWRADFWQLVKSTPYLRWLILTKRVGNLAGMLPPDWGGGYSNVSLGITVTDDKEAARDIPKLLQIPAWERFLSLEPLLGAIRVAPWLHLGIHWVIAGGESGPHARPMHPDWARSLRDQCAAAGVPFLFKQWGEWMPRGPESMGYPVVNGVPRIRLTDRGENGQDLASKGDNHCWMQRAGKDSAGRLLDGQLHNSFPTHQRNEA